MDELGRISVSCQLSPASAKAFRAFVRGLPMEFRSDPRLTEAFLALSACTTAALNEAGETYEEKADWSNLNLPYAEEAIAARQNAVDIARRMFETAVANVGKS
jgi:hypothetical protein